MAPCRGREGGSSSPVGIRTPCTHPHKNKAGVGITSAQMHKCTKQRCQQSKTLWQRKRQSEMSDQTNNSVKMHSGCFRYQNVTQRTRDSRRISDIGFSLPVVLKYARCCFSVNPSSPKRKVQIPIGPRQCQIPMPNAQNAYKCTNPHVPGAKRTNAQTHKSAKAQIH